MGSSVAQKIQETFRELLQCRQKYKKNTVLYRTFSLSHLKHFQDFVMPLCSLIYTVVIYFKVSEEVQENRVAHLDILWERVHFLGLALLVVEHNFLKKTMSKAFELALLGSRVC